MHDVYAAIGTALLLSIAIPGTLAALYLFALTLFSGASPPPTQPSRGILFDVIVPAHNEEIGISTTVENLLLLDWPKDQFRIVVIADNCIDATAQVAGKAGAYVVERHDSTQLGKGYALAHAFDWSRTQKWAEAVVVVDADSAASSNLLRAFAARIERGAVAMQVHYGVLNPSASWRTRLMAIALGAIHKLRSRAREKLKLSCGIRGNGWCVTHDLLREIPYKAFSLTEDVEFGVDLGLAGHRVAYCDEADLNGEMVSTADAARSQRQRWEGGRLKLIREKVPTLLLASVTNRSAVCLDLALDLLVLPLSYIVLNVVAIIVLAGLARNLTSPAWLWLGVFDMLALVIYVCRGWMLSGIGLSGFWDLLRVPGYVIWKLALLVSQRKPTTWVRTKREGS